MRTTESFPSTHKRKWGRKQREIERGRGGEEVREKQKERGRGREREEEREGWGGGGREREYIHVAGIIFQVCLPRILGGGSTIDHAVTTTLAGGHLKVVSDASIVSKVMTQPGDTDTIMVGLSSEIGDGSNFCIVWKGASNNHEH